MSPARAEFQAAGIPLAAWVRSPLSSARMKRRDFLTLLPLAAGAISWGCRRKLRPELIKIVDFEDRKGGWRVIKVACVGDSITYGAGV